MSWAVGRVPLRLRRHNPNDPYTYQEGLVSGCGVWGLHLDGEHIDLTHMPSGKRLSRFPSLGQAAQAAEHLSSITSIWSMANPEQHLEEHQLADIERIIALYQIRT